MTDNQSSSVSSKSTRSLWLKLAVLSVVGVLGGVLYFQFGDSLTLKALANRE